VRRLNPIICDPEVLSSNESFDDVDRKARGDVVGVEVVEEEVVRENASAHSYRRYVCCIFRCLLSVCLYSLSLSFSAFSISY